MIALRNIIISLFFLGTFSATAQDIHFGVKGGLNLANFSTDLEAQTAVGYHGGVFFAFELNRFGIRPELLYSTKGAETSFSFTDPNTQGITEVSNDANLRYLDVPVLLEYKVLPFVRLQAGPQFSLLLDQETTVDVTNLSGSVDEFRQDYDYEDLDLGLAVGVGVNVFMLDVGLRYTWGITKVSEFEQRVGNDPSDIRDYELQNNVFQVSVGYRFK